MWDKILGGSPVSTNPLPFQGDVGFFNGFGNLAVNDQETVFFSQGFATTAFDINAGVPKWTLPASLVALKDDGGAFLQNADHTVQSADTNGNLGSDLLLVNRNASYMAPGVFSQEGNFGAAGLLKTDSAQLTGELALVWPVPSFADPEQTFRAISFSVQKHIDTDDPPQGSNFKNVPLLGIAMSQTESVLVKLLPESSPVTLTLSSSGTGAANFDDGSAQGSATITIPANVRQQVVSVKGLIASDKADDLALSAKLPDQTVIGTPQKFSVVTVTLRMNTTGNVSPDNTTRADYIRFSGVGSDTLGPVVIPFSAGSLSGCRTAVELIGDVTPKDFKGSIILKRTLLEASDWSATAFIQSFPQKPDTSFPDDRDDTPSSQGHVFDLDLPGLSNASLFFGLTRRFRQNFSEYAVLDLEQNSVPVSGAFSWYSRTSCLVGRNGPQFLHDVPGDNQAGPGCTKLSFDLVSADHAGTVCQ